MIEQRFIAGIRFLWTKPNDSMGPANGAIVASTGVANNLTYDGLDGHKAAVSNALLTGAPIGMAMGTNVPHAWLDYAPGRTSRLQIGVNDILTGYMSGCLIIRGTHSGAMSAFHVGTIVGNAAVNKKVKDSFARDLPADATGFNPAGAWNPGEIANKQIALGGGTVATPNILALVTTTGAFYSVLMFNVLDGGSWTNPAGIRYWCVGGIKQVPAINRVGLMASLMS